MSATAHNRAMKSDRAIEWARATIIERPTSARLRTSYGEAPVDRPHVIVEIGAEGIVGLGEASPLPEFTGETAASILHILKERYLDALIGLDVTEIGPIVAHLERLLPGNTSARAAIDMALHDAAGKVFGVPVSTLLGGARRSSIRTVTAMGIETVPDAVAQAERSFAEGFRTFKMKVGTDPVADVARVRAVREALGADAIIRIDANQGYDPPTAIAVLRRLEDCDIEYIEQPVARWNHAGLAHVRRATGARVLADESLHSIQDALNLIRAEACDLFAIKLIKTGGLARARQIAGIGEAAGIDCIVISPFETQIGSAAGLHMALALPICHHAHELTVFASQANMARTGIRLDGEILTPAAAPGLGVDGIVEMEHGTKTEP
jgi:L-Ala-D/L-Glu epimerase / N-acetyl-D-glutamate racemase